MKRVVVSLGILLSLVMAVVYGLPVFAQSYVATFIPGQPLSRMAAQQVIENSGLPIETLPDGTTNSLTRGRDAVNAYRQAHQALSQNGWYKGLSGDHTPLLMAMVDALEAEGYVSSKSEPEPCVGCSQGSKSGQVLGSFWEDSNRQNAWELGFISKSALLEEIGKLDREGRVLDSFMLSHTYNQKWN